MLYERTPYDECRSRREIGETRAVLEREYGKWLDRVVLFGSQARGDATSDSDIDLLVVLRREVVASEEVARMSRHLADISLRHDVVASCVFVSDERFQNGASPFLMNVRREGVAA
ncbi:MAG: nucleotidyltransferase domain-containing protein [Gemmatimonas sp.]|nr:nucleotidyltransferase domain-containing protein [Gemmatimonas sp.]